MADGLRYCPECGAEYYASAVRCADCDVALVRTGEQRPPVSAPLTRTLFEATRPTARLDISTLSSSQSYELQQRLDRADIRFAIVRDELLVGIPQADDARDLMAAMADEQPGDDEPYDPNPFARPQLAGLGRPASRLQRLGGAVIDSLLFGVLARTAVVAGASWWAVAVAQGLVITGMVAAFGASPGKFALGSRVVDVHTGRRPRLRSSALRWATPFVLAVAGFVAPRWGGVLLLLGELASAVLVLFSPDGRAVHDLVAGTIVVRHERVAAGR